MKWRQVSSGSFTNIRFETKEYGGEFLHIVTQVGTLDLEDRAPILKETLDLNKSENYFCILDNRKGKESFLSIADMSYFADRLIDKGIKRFFYAVVTNDPAYDKIIKLIKAIAITKDMEVEAMSTADFATAESFMLTRMKNFVNAS
ncbi:hypothetical protein [Sneathiella litorea]|uniref:STAS domain-containing protein n=1 Tax=Sneathiella litorea TaxID=2606216 RepID=A0A6L8WBP2_9PROT|nr:hypothetical protein [Sneathiella litorea]MZR32089.1 hypothetical protein [Sneathiella litorea]